MILLGVDQQIQNLARLEVVGITYRVSEDGYPRREAIR